jgi:hypothetical protein
MASAQRRSNSDASFRRGWRCFGSTGALRVVGDAGKQPPQLDRGRELAALLVDGADCGGIRLGDDKHTGSMRLP